MSEIKLSNVFFHMGLGCYIEIDGDEEDSGRWATVFKHNTMPFERTENLVHVEYSDINNASEDYSLLRRYSPHLIFNSR